MSLYKQKYNPLAHALNLVPATTAVTFKEAVPTFADLPSTGNIKGDGRITNDTGHLYMWDGTAWQDQGDIVDITWDALTGKPISTPANIDDAVSKKHSNSLDHAAHSDDQDLSGKVDKVVGSSLVPDTEILKIHALHSDDQDISGKEDSANKSTDVALGTSDTLYPSQKAVKDYVDTAIENIDLPIFNVQGIVQSPSTDVDICNGGSAWCGPVAPIGDPLLAFDNDENTNCWIRGGAFIPHWIGYDLGVGVAKIVTTLRFKVGMHNEGIDTFTFKGSNDGTNYTTLYSGNAANNSDWQEFTFANATAYRYYKIDDIWTYSPPEQYLRVYEVEMKEPSPSYPDYIVAPGAVGLFSGQDNNLAQWNGTAWEFRTLEVGSLVYILNINREYIYNGATWKDTGIMPDVDPLLTANSDALVPSQKAIKEYVDTEIAGIVIPAPDLSEYLKNTNVDNETIQYTASPLDIYLNSLFHFDGVNGATSTLDEKGANTIVLVNGANISSDLSKFGGTSLRFHRYQTQFAYITYSPSINLGLMDEGTIDFWMYTDIINQYEQRFIGQPGYWMFQIHPDGVVRWWSDSIDMNIGTITAQEWHHAALVKEPNSSVVKLYWDGIYKGSHNASSYSHVCPLYIGFDGQYEPSTGNVDELRISHKARWLTNFTPPTQAYSLYVDGQISVKVDVDPTLAADSDLKVASQKAVKAYVDNFPPVDLSSYLKNTQINPDTMEYDATPIDTYLTSLFNFNGTNGDTTTLDEKVFRTITLTGSSLSNTNPKFGATSLNVARSTGSYAEIPYNANWNFYLIPEGTIEFWVKLDAVINISQRIFGSDPADYSGWGLSCGADGRMGWRHQYDYWTGSPGLNLGNVEANRWYHIAAVKEFGTTVVKIYLDGVYQGSGNDINYHHAVPLRMGFLGRYEPTGGNFDDLRFSDKARYTANFIPPKSQFSIYFDGRIGVNPDTDPTLSANSDDLVPSQKAIKEYVDTEIGDLIIPIAPDLTPYLKIADANPDNLIYSETVALDVYTKLLLHCDGAIDETGKTVTNVNGVFSNLIKKFGTYSVYFPSNGYFEVPASSDFDFGSGNFTIDFWANWAGFPSTGFLYCSQSVDGAFAIYLESMKFSFLTYDVGGTTAQYISTDAWAGNTDEWYHLAFVRNGANFKLYINGINHLLTLQTAIGTIAPTNAPLIIGNHPNHISGPFARYDELRVSKGIARWTTDFTPPTAEYTGTLNRDFAVKFDVDPTLAADSDVRVASQKAIKQYVDDSIPSISGKEDVANKSTNTSLGTSDTLYPSQKAVKEYVDTAVGSGGASVTRGTFTNTDLVAGILTVTHSKALTAPYSLVISVFNNNAKMVIPDDVTGLTNTFKIDLTSFGTITGTWGYAYLA